MKNEQLNRITRSIISYTYLNFMIKGYALVVGISLFFIASLYHQSASFPTINMALTFIVLALWQIDAHTYRTKIAYSRLYQSICNKKTPSNSMDTGRFMKDIPMRHILWKFHTSSLYVAIITAAAIFSFIKI